MSEPEENELAEPAREAHAEPPQLAEPSQLEEAAEGDDADLRIPVKRRRRGGLLGNAMLGLEAALYGNRQNEIVVVADADGMPEPDFDVQLTPDPRDSVVIMRRHWWRPRHKA